MRATGSVDVTGNVVSHSATGMTAPQFTVNPAPVAPFTGLPLVRTAAALNAHHTSAFRILSPDDTHFLDFNVHNTGDSVLEATEGVDVKGLHLPDVLSSGVLATDSTGKIIAGTPGATAFGAVGAGTNTNALVMGSGGSLTSSGTGTVNANRINAGTVPANANVLATNANGQIIQGTPYTGGPVSISDLANATHDHTIDSYDNYNEIASHFTSNGGGYSWLLWDNADSSAASGYQLYIWNKGDDNVIPLDVGIGINGWTMEPHTGDFVARGESRIAADITSGLHKLTIDFYLLSGGMVESPGPNRRWSMNDTIFGNDYKHDAIIGADPHHMLTEVPDDTRGNRVAFASTFLGGHGDHMKTGDVVLQSGDNEGHNEEEQTGSVNISPGLVRSPEVSHPMNGALSIAVGGYGNTDEVMGTLACVHGSAFSPSTGPHYGRCSQAETQAGKWVGVFKEYVIVNGVKGHSLSVAVVGQTFFASSSAQQWNVAEAICSSPTNTGYLVEEYTCTPPSVMVGIVTYDDTVASNTHWGVILSHR
jgi:hypothetical protein